MSPHCRTLCPQSLPERDSWCLGHRHRPREGARGEDEERKRVWGVREVVGE